MPGEPNPPLSRPQTANEMRVAAERARRLAREIPDRIVKANLISLADEMEAGAAALEAADAGKNKPRPGDRPDLP